MADVTLVDLVKITASTTGTGAVTLGSPVPGYRGVEALLNGAVYSYAIQQEAEYEVGTGTYLASGNQFIRTPGVSSNGGTAIDLQPNAAIAFVATAQDILGRDVLRPLYGFGKPLVSQGIVGQTYTDLTVPVTLYGPKTANGWGAGVILQGDPGAPGTAATYRTLAELRAADPAALFYALIAPEGLINYGLVSGDFTGKIDDVNVVQLDAVPVTTGALVRQQAKGIGFTQPYASSKASDAYSELVKLPITPFSQMDGEERAEIMSRGGGFDATQAVNDTFGNATDGARTTLFPNGDYLVGNVVFGRQNQEGQSLAPLGMIGESKAGVTLRAKPGLTGTLLKANSVAGATFRDFSIDTTGSSAVAWDARWFFAGPSTQNVIRDITVTVHNNFTDGQTAHVNWNDLNDTYCTGVTVRPSGGVTDYTNMFISAVGSGGLMKMANCIWTGGFLNFGCQVGYVDTCWGHGMRFAASCLNHVEVTAGYNYGNPVHDSVYWSESPLNGNSIRTLIVNLTENNSQVAPGVSNYFDINLLGMAKLNGVEFIGSATKLLGPNSRGAGVSRALVVVEAGTHDGALVLNDVFPNVVITPATGGTPAITTGSGIEIEAKGFMNVVTTEMVTKNRGGSFEPIIRGGTTVGTYTRGSATFGRLIRNGNIANFKVRVDWSAHTAPNTEPAILTGFPLDRDADGIESAVLEFSSLEFAGARASFSGNQVSFYKTDNSLVMLPASGSVVVSGFYSVKA